MENIRGAQTSDFTIPAGSRIDIPTAGEFVRCLASTAAFKLQVNGGPVMYMQAGIQWRSEALTQYEQFSLINESGAAITVTMAWGYGEVSDNRLALPGSLVITSITNPVSIGGVVMESGGQNATYGAVSVGVAATLIFAADSTGTGWIIHNDAANTVYLGTDNAVTTANGLPVLAGEKVGWDNRTALWAISTVAAQSVRYLKGAV